MKTLLQDLLKLQALEFNPPSKENTSAQVAELRAKIPAQIIGHFDRLVVRGKKGVAVVRNQVCTGCHMHIPIGTINTLMQGTDVQLCGSCGRYLYLPDPAETQFVEAVAAAKPARKTRKRKAAAAASLTHAPA